MVEKMFEFEKRGPKEKSAEQLLNKLKLLLKWTNGLPEKERRAFIVEFDGMPKAGKSSVIEIIRHFFTHGPKIEKRKKGSNKHYGPKDGYRVHSPAEGVSLRTPGYLKSDLLVYNTWAGSYAIQRLIEARHENRIDIDILDRGPWDAGCWLEYVSNHPPEGVDAGEIKRIAEFFQLPLWVTKTDLHVVLVVEPGEAARRAREGRLSEHLGPAAKPDMMKEMRSIYKERYESLREVKATECPHVGRRATILIDTTSKEKLKIAEQIIERIFEVLDRKLLKRKSQDRLTEKTVLEYLDSYAKAMKAAERRLLRDYIAQQFVPGANRLSGAKRAKLCERRSVRELTEHNKVHQRKVNLKAEKIILELAKLLEQAG